MLTSGQQSSGRSRSYWMSSIRSQTFDPLNRPIKIDVAIVGAGIAGLTAAYTLSKQGKSVAVFDDGLLLSGETSRTSAHLASYVDGRIDTLIKKFGVEKTRLIVEGHKDAINWIEKIASEENISCEFRRVFGYLFCLGDKKDVEQEARALEEIKNLPFEWVLRAPINTVDTGRCIKISDQAEFHPVKYLEGILSAIVKNGGQVFENTHISSIKDGTPCTLLTDNQIKITAKDVIVTTDSPINDRVTMHTKQAQYRTYIVGISVPKNDIEAALYWDTEDPYHYIRLVHSPKPDRAYVIIGGEDHQVGHGSEKEALLRLKSWVYEQFPEHETIYEWSGQVVEPVDGIAFTGRNPGDKHVYIHTSSAGNGLTYGTIAGTLLPALILGQESPLAEILDPNRKPVTAPLLYIKEAFNSFAPYSDWLKPHVGELSSLKPHEGCIVRHGLTHHAVYKDVDGKLHRMSAVCPHLGGIVRWNSFEKTWDCPCHGSRFTHEGEVIHGPANKGLKKIKKHDN